MREILEKCLPQSWLNQNRNILVFGFEIFSIHEHSFADQNPKYFLQNEIFVIFYWGKIEYIKTLNTEGISSVGHHTSGIGCQCLVGSLVQEDGPNIIGSMAHEKITTVAGLLKIIYRQNFQKLFENVYSPATARINSSEGFMFIARYPQVTPIDPSLFRTISAFFEHLSSVQRDATKKKIIASLRWILSAADTINTDTFIKHFLAVEMLGASSSSTIIQDINKKIAAIYEIEFEEAKQFGFKKIDRLRGKVIHEGTILAFPINEIDFLKALYSDILLFELRLPTERSLKANFNKKFLSRL